MKTTHKYTVQGNLCPDPDLRPMIIMDRNPLLSVHILFGHQATTLSRAGEDSRYPQKIYSLMLSEFFVSSRFSGYIALLDLHHAVYAKQL